VTPNGKAKFAWMCALMAEWSLVLFVPTLAASCFLWLLASLYHWQAAAFIFLAFATAVVVFLSLIGLGVDISIRRCWPVVLIDDLREFSLYLAPALRTTLCFPVGTNSGNGYNYSLSTLPLPIQISLLQTARRRSVVYWSDVTSAFRAAGHHMGPRQALLHAVHPCLAASLEEWEKRTSPAAVSAVDALEQAATLDLLVPAPRLAAVRSRL
jgi:hypothetical protein